MLEPPARADARRLWEFFTGNGYTEEGLCRELGSSEPPSRVFRTQPLVLDRTRGGRPLDHLVRWFLCSLPIREEEIGESLPEWFLPVAEGAGMLARRDGAWYPETLISTLGGLLLASDPVSRLYDEERQGHVLAVSPSARYLAAFAMRHPVGTTLDLGAGNGVQALAAASTSGTVVATDLNPRATEFADFNARLNGFTNIECLTGDAFEPVVGRRFDRILCNPPFVVSPGGELVCLESGEELDGFCRRIVRQVPGFLEEGGVFQMILEWVEIAGTPWKERLTAWLDGSGCDAIIFRNYSEIPSVYALNRVKESTADGGEIDSAYDEWVRFYRERNVESIHGGLLAMHRRAGENWIRIDDRAPGRERPFGDAVLGTFRARDYLDGTGAPDEVLLSSRPTLATGLGLHQDYEALKEGWTTQSLRLVQTEGLRHEIGLDGGIAAFLGRLDGNHTLEELVQDMAKSAGANPVEVRPQCLATVRVMIANGFVLPDGA